MDEGPLRSGDLIADTYRIERHVGGGGMGQVYAASDVRTGAQVALKLLSIDHADQRDLDRFQREVELAARVDRKGGVVRVHAVGTFKGRPYCVMEFVEGQDLHSLLERGPLDCERACGLLESVARTLAACHGEGVIHRDLKPANIMIDSDGAPKVADFGLARDMASDGLTRTGELVGTPAYMAPEQALDASRAVDAAVDIYALGAVLYHAITGQPPFTGTSVLQVLSEVASVDPPRPRSIRPDLPADLEAVCMRAMAKDPADRYPSMTALADDLARAARGSQVEARPISAWERFSRRLAQREPVAVGAAVGATLLVVLAVLGPAWVVLDRSRQRRAAELLTAAETYQREALDPWALGIGDGPPPKTASFLADEAALLERMAPHLPPGDRARGSELAEMFSAQGRLLEGRLAPERNDPSAAAVDAVLMAREGDIGPARERLAPAQRAKNPLAPLAWSAMWHETLLRYGRAESLECLRDAPRVGKLPPVGEEVVRQAAVLLLGEGIEKTVQDGSSDFADLESVSLTTRASLERALPDDTADVAWVTVRTRALASTARMWTKHFASTAPTDTTPTHPRELLKPAQALRSLLRSEPPIELPPALDVALRDLFLQTAGAVDTPAALSARQRVAGWWALALETVAYYQLGWRCPRTEAYEQFLRKEMRLSARPVPRLDLAVAIARHGILVKNGEVFQETLIDVFAGRARPLAFVPPESVALRWIELERALHRAADGALSSPSREVLLAQAEEVFEPGIDDLSPPYRARARYLLCKLLRSELTRGAPSRSRAERLLREGKALMDEAVESDQITESLHSLITAGGQTGREIDVRAIGRRSLNAMRTHALRPVAEDQPALLHKRQEDQRRFVELGLEYSKLLGRRPEDLPETETLLREATELCERFKLPLDLRQELALTFSDLLRDMHRPKEAEAILRPFLEAGLRAKSQFAKEAVRVALELGDLEEARRRLQIAEEHHQGREALKSAREHYERALRRERER